MIDNKYYMQKFNKKRNKKRIAPSLPVPPSPQGCGCGGDSEQRKNIIRKVVNKRIKRNK